MDAQNRFSPNNSVFFSLCTTKSGVGHWLTLAKGKAQQAVVFI